MKTYNGVQLNTNSLGLKVIRNAYAASRPTLTFPTQRFTLAVLAGVIVALGRLAVNP
jgi:hypothetical protein